MNCRIKPLKCLLVVCVVMVGACDGSSDDDDNAESPAAPNDDPISDAEPGVPGVPAEPVAVIPSDVMLINSFPTSGGIGLGFDQVSDTIWTFGGTTFRQYDRDGNLLVTLTPEAGESANDADLDFSTVDMSLGGVDIQAGTILFTNGETDVADVYAIGIDGTIFSTLNTEFGASHVVGSAYSETRGTLFLLQDNVPTAELDNRVAEIDVDTGEVINTFDLDDLENSYDIFFGDLEVDNATGNLLITSSSEDEILQLTPEGEELSRLVIADGAEGSLGGSGIALDEVRSELYVQDSSGRVFRYSYGN